REPVTGGCAEAQLVGAGRLVLELKGALIIRFLGFHLAAIVGKQRHEDRGYAGLIDTLLPITIQIVPNAACQGDGLSHRRLKWDPPHATAVGSREEVLTELAIGLNL